MGGSDQGLWLAHGFNRRIPAHIHLAVWLPAHASPSRRQPLFSQVDAFASLLDALEIQKVAVFAASAGTTTAIRFAARHPERISALTLLSPDAPGKVQAEMPPKFIFDTLLRSDFVYWALVDFFRGMGGKFDRAGAQWVHSFT